MKMRYLSVCSDTLKKNKELVDVTLYEPPIIIWELGQETNRVFSFEFDDCSLVYKPECPLPNGATVYIEVYE